MSLFFFSDVLVVIRLSSVDVNRVLAEFAVKLIWLTMLQLLVSILDMCELFIYLVSFCMFVFKGLCPAACRNGGTCFPVGVNDFVCSCLPQYNGKSCEIVVGEILNLVYTDSSFLKTKYENIYIHTWLLWIWLFAIIMNTRTINSRLTFIVGSCPSTFCQNSGTCVQFSSGISPTWVLISWLLFCDNCQLNIFVDVHVRHRLPVDSVNSVLLVSNMIFL